LRALAANSLVFFAALRPISKVLFILQVLSGSGGGAGIAVEDDEEEEVEVLVEEAEAVAAAVEDVEESAEGEAAA